MLALPTNCRTILTTRNWTEEEGREKSNLIMQQFLKRSKVFLTSKSKFLYLINWRHLFYIWYSSRCTMVWKSGGGSRPFPEGGSYISAFERERSPFGVFIPFLLTSFLKIFLRGSCFYILSPLMLIYVPHWSFIIKTNASTTPKK